MQAVVTSLKAAAPVSRSRCMHDGPRRVGWAGNREQYQPHAINAAHERANASKSDPERARTSKASRNRGQTTGNRTHARATPINHTRTIMRGHTRARTGGKTCAHEQTRAHHA